MTWHSTYPARGLAAALFALALASPVRVGALRADEPPGEPPFLIASHMLEQLSGSAPTDAMMKPLRLLAPMIGEVKGRFGVDLRPPLARAIASRDGAAAARLLVLLVLYDAEGHFSALKRDALTGWRAAKIHAMKGYLDYSLASSRVRRLAPALDGQALRHLRQLLEGLKKTDLTTPAGELDGARQAVVQDLRAARRILQSGALP